MDEWRIEMNGSEIAPADQNKQINHSDRKWLRDNLLPVIVPIKDVGYEFVRNAIFGIPEECPIIFISATEDADMRAQERSIIEQNQGRQERDILWIPQDNTGIQQFLETNYPTLIEDGEIAQGYREALLIGVFAVKSLGAEYLAVVDGDNWSPMSIHEFVMLYARGFRNGGDYISLEWRCKPKCGPRGFEWRESGRTSGLINSYMDSLVVEHAENVNFAEEEDGETEQLITSSCSGDHAMTVELWDEIRHTTNHSGEVNAFIQIMEGNPEATLLQYKTMSPMFHQYGEEEHIEQERIEGFKAIHRSKLCTDEIAEEIEEECGEEVKEDLKEYPTTDNVGGGFLSYLDTIAE